MELADLAASTLATNSVTCGSANCVLPACFRHCWPQPQKRNKLSRKVDQPVLQLHGREGEEGKGAAIAGRGRSNTSAKWHDRHGA